jgi:hypothetical protein
MASKVLAVRAVCQVEQRPPIDVCRNAYGWCGWIRLLFPEAKIAERRQSAIGDGGIDRVPVDTSPEAPNDLETSPVARSRPAKPFLQYVTLQDNLSKSRDRASPDILRQNGRAQRRLSVVRPNR